MKENKARHETFGPCVSKERCLEILAEEIQNHLPKSKWGEYERAVNRVRYEFAKLNAVKPKLYRASRRQFDYWKCGNCGSGIREITMNYCPNCGFEIKWDGIRCLTGRERDNTHDRNE